MKSKILKFTSIACMIMGSWHATIGQISVVTDYQNSTSPIIGTYQGIQFKEAGFSGLYAIPGTNGKEFWTVTDRGVNIDAANANLSGCRPTYDKIYAFPLYAPKIMRIRVEGNSIQILRIIPIRNPKKLGSTGIINPTGLGSTMAEVPSTDTVQDCLRFNLKTTLKDTWGIDAEGIVLDHEGNFWICEEGGPTIWKLDPNGVVINRFTPYADLAGAQPQDILIDTCFRYRKNNRGFEGIAITPNGKIYAFIQSPLLYPNKTIGEGTRVHRILEIDPLTHKNRMFVYLNDGIIGTGSNQIRLRDWKIGDAVAVNNNEFLILEAAARGTTDIKRLYRINISGATPIKSGLYSGKTIEAAVDSLGMAALGVKAAKKTLVMDLLANGWPASLDKAEGVTIINDSTIAINNDNDYGQYSPNEDGLAVATGKSSHLITYSLKGINKITGYVPATNNVNSGLTGPSTSKPPYLRSTTNGAIFTSLLTVGDSIGGYKLAGLPDGSGALDNNDGTISLFVAHEINSSLGNIRAHGQKGAFISKWIVRKSDMAILSGSDLIKNVYTWSGGTYNLNESGKNIFSRFCSGDLPGLTAFYNPVTMKGTLQRIFLNGEEMGSSGRAFGHVLSGADAGKTWELPRLGKFSWENALASTFVSDKTIVIGTDDASPGQVYVYIGSKTSTGNEIEKAGLTNGLLYGIAVDGITNESSSAVISNNTAFTLKALGNVADSSGTVLNAMSNTLGITNFLRPEDGAWDPTNPRDFYFVTTNSFSAPSRMYRLRFHDMNNPLAGGTITTVIDGTKEVRMMDNMCIDNAGNAFIQEDVGNNEHLGKIWRFSTNTNELELVADHDPTLFTSGAINYLTLDEESSGIFDAQAILGPGMFLLNTQAHYSIPGELVEGGQLLAYYNPQVAAANPEIAITGGSIDITNGKTAILATDNTAFGRVGINYTQLKTFTISNTGKGDLILGDLSILGTDASSFTLLNAPPIPFRIKAGEKFVLSVQFMPKTIGSKAAVIVITNNDNNESPFYFNIGGDGINGGISGPSTLQNPYLLPSAPGVTFTSMLTVGEKVGNYTMCGLMDGLGALDNGNGTFTLLVQHEITSSAGIERAHGQKGAFISKWTINKSNLAIISGSDLVQNVKIWNGTDYDTYNKTNPNSKAAFNRFCSADLPEITAFYNSTTHKGTTERIFLGGEEAGSEGRAFGHILTGPNTGTSYELPHLGKFSWENTVANPSESDKTVVIGTDDATPGQVYVYVGVKSANGTEIEKAGLTGGKLYGIKVSGLAAEISGSIPAAGTAFSLVDLGDASKLTGAQLHANSNTLGVTNFLRPEDGAWDPSNPRDFYFVTTNSFASPSRMWRLRFNDPSNPELGGSITAVLDGTEGPKMMDNIGIDKFGHILIQEDPGNTSYIAKIWEYDILKDKVTQIGEHDETRFITGSVNFLTQDEESSGIIDMQGILGPGMFILVDQAHYSLSGELVEGGQLLAMYNPSSFASNPELDLTGNGTSIQNGNTLTAEIDNTFYGTAVKGTTLFRNFVIKNNGFGPLTINGFSIVGLNAADFGLASSNPLPIVVAPGASSTFVIRFSPSSVGHRAAVVNVMTNDFDEPIFSFAIAGQGMDASAGTTLQNQSNDMTLYPNPARDEVEVIFAKLSGGSTTVSVLDSRGTQVLPMQQFVANGDPLKIKLNTQLLPHGLYFVEVKNDKVNYKRKFIIQK